MKGSGDRALRPATFDVFGNGSDRKELAEPG
jgi:hypothetical protein